MALLRCQRRFSGPFATIRATFRCLAEGSGFEPLEPYLGAHGLANRRITALPTFRKIRTMIGKIDCGAPGRARTHNTPGRSRVLYPIELRAHGALPPASSEVVPLAWNRTRNRPGTDRVLCRLSYSGDRCSRSIFHENPLVEN